MLAAQIGCLRARFVFAQNRNDLLFRKPRTLHRPYPFQGPALCSNSEEVQRLRSLPKLVSNDDLPTFVGLTAALSAKRTGGLTYYAFIARTTHCCSHRL